MLLVKIFIRIIMLPLLLIMIALQWIGTVLHAVSAPIATLLAGMFCLISVAAFVFKIETWKEALCVLIVSMILYLLPIISQLVIQGIPVWSSFDLLSIKSTFGQCFNFSKISFNPVDFLIIMSSFLFVDLFDTLGTLVGVANKANMLDKDGKLPRIKQALLADAIATSVGAVLGTSTTTTFVESSSGIAEGGRTGLASVVTGFLFLASLFLAPVFTTIPSFATAPALIFVGFLMVSTVVEIKFDEMTEAIPAYLCLLCMPLMYSISEGIAVGVISYVVINVAAGKAKKITPLMYVLAVLFVLKYMVL